MQFNFYATLVAMVIVLLVGRFVIGKVGFLHKYNIPAPVVGGIIVAFILSAIHFGLDIKISFDNSMQDPLMLVFFASIGLSADFASLKNGGKILVVFLACVAGLLILQNILGISMAILLGENPLLGLLSGSVTMTGGHGTGGAWAKIFQSEPYSFTPAFEVAMSVATFGLVMGGIIGGPVARYLIKKHNLKPNISDYSDIEPNSDENRFENQGRLITAESCIESLALIAIALLVGTSIESMLKNTIFALPAFLWCLFVGVLLRNFLQYSNIYKVFDREIAVIGDISLALFLSLALLTINLIGLINLALPIFLILGLQIILMILFAIFVTFHLTGANYDSAVLAAGHCGFGLGATPTAMVNMQTITQHYGASRVAFVVVPLVGAFFVDLINAIAIQIFLSLIKGFYWV